jgi:hypothetical protein
MAVCQFLRGDWLDALELARKVEPGETGTDH